MSLSRHAAIGLLLLFAIAFGGFAAWVHFFNVPAYRSLLWKPTPATILEVSTSRHPSRVRAEMYSASIRYEYTFNGQSYQSTALTLDQLSYPSAPLANRIDEATYQRLSNAPIGSSIAVAVDPANPANAVVRPGLTRRQFFVAAFVSGFAAVPILCVIEIISIFIRSNPQRYPGGFQLIETPTQTRIRTANIGPTRTASLPSFGFTILASIVTLAVPLDSPTKVLIALISIATLVPGLALLCTLAFRFHLRNGESDIVIDHTAQTLTLPSSLSFRERMFGPDAPPTVTANGKTYTPVAAPGRTFPIHTIHNVFTDYLQPPNSPQPANHTATVRPLPGEIAFLALNSALAYIPQDPKSQTHSVFLTRFHYDGDAEPFAVWLRSLLARLLRTPD